MALYKAYPKKGKTCKVTFVLPVEASNGVSKVALVGDFNNWESGTHLLSLDKDGLFSITITLKQGSEYEFRYLMDDERWENDWAADRYTQSTFGNCDNSVVIV
ncbi:MAG TPA: glycoside hydrolase [Treponema sp.]|nr:glycoside hydrolase [Treponema sp.]